MMGKDDGEGIEASRHRGIKKLRQRGSEAVRSWGLGGVGIFEKEWVDDGQEKETCNDFAGGLLRLPHVAPRH